MRRRLKHYNLDAIISVGYRVNTRRGVRFRRWATRTLHGHLVRGFTLNARRLAERGLREARETLDLLARTLRNKALVDDSGQAVLSPPVRVAWWQPTYSGHLRGTGVGCAAGNVENLD